MADGLIATIDVPKLGELLLGNAGRAHNRIARAAVSDTLLTHATRRIPGHFARSAHRKYGYADRAKPYIFWKQKKYGHTADLVMTGATQHGMSTQRSITVGGTAVGGNLRGDLKLRFPFGALAQKAWARRARGEARGAPLAARTRRDGKPRVTISQMKKEVAATTPDEVREISQEIRDRYVEGVKTTTGPRQRVKI
ncbi:MAG TPA: hypothetical protein VG826_29225 [Pirellulales bacterium]|nr:hypothetical protein [Pirellulales bacterium]